jgi:hypothetical protein
MARYRLIDVGFPYKKIMNGRKWVGRVYQHADGHWICAINKQDMAKGKTPNEAFRDGVAKHLGFKNVTELETVNRETARRNREHKADARQAFNRFMAGDYTALDRWFGVK